ncbi:LysM peptidoglycan-binding domain-containing protein [Flavobacterium sp. 3HN19-14]|uniref:LysM peptidoglycan-binding domain-containing protein n=1 Tax=Flavobacterium sp. 3HN19-14 TaxID=3448133 RepID=UPI003EDF2776
MQKGDNLNNIAKKFNVSIADLKEWNNMESNNVMLDTKLKIIKGENTDNAIADADETEKATPSIAYTIQKGDNISSIARKYGVTAADIRKWNEIESNDIKVGNKIFILKEVKTSKAVVAENEKKTSHYLVKKGDSLYIIAKKSGVTVADIKKWNSISGDELKPGMKLKING